LFAAILALGTSVFVFCGFVSAKNSMKSASVASGEPAYTQDDFYTDGFFKGINKTRAYTFRYRQTEYNNKNDLQGDYSLATFLDPFYTLPKALWWTLTGKDFGAIPTCMRYEGENPILDLPADSKPQAGPKPSVTAGRENTFRKQEMLTMYSTIMVEEEARGLAPKFGEPHEWSPGFEREYLFATGKAIGASKLLYALTAGVSSNYLYAGKETELIKWILAQPDLSIYPHAIFQASYRINKGDVYLTLLTIENVLSDGWRRPHREKSSVTRKLAPITVYAQGYDDKFGSWYHFHGIMLYSYSTGFSRASFAQLTETIGSDICDLSHDPQEDWSNLMGAKIGSFLSSIVRFKRWHEFAARANGKNVYDPKFYLDLSEDLNNDSILYQSDFLQLIVHSVDYLASSLVREHGGGIYLDVSCPPTAKDTCSVIVSRKWNGASKSRKISLNTGEKKRIGPFRAGERISLAIERPGQAAETVQVVIPGQSSRAKEKRI
ncbi:MAG: hypothetical protein WCS77_06600, partial [Elusimicrobiaceae bacterium]